MKPERDTRKAMRARFNQARTHVKMLTAVLDADPERVTNVDIADMRDYAEQLLQCVHEFSAYWNVMFTGNDEQNGRAARHERGSVLRVVRALFLPYGVEPPAGYEPENCTDKEEAWIAGWNDALNAVGAEFDSDDAPPPPDEPA